MSKLFKRILIANRGDSAVRVIRACKELGIETISIFSNVDRGALHTRLADYAVCIGDKASKDSYLNSYNIITVATEYGVDAIHPGIGFFSESTDFCELCKKCGIKYIGPGSESIALMGNKIQAKKVAKLANVPVIGDDSMEVHSYHECLEYARNVGFPIILKAANGGGGKGIRVVERDQDLKQALEMCMKESEKAFGSSSILIERYIKHAKHIEVQVLADQFGNVIHLGDRECSIQRKNQKLIEETRCTTISEENRQKMYQGAIDICTSIGYVGVGTIEYILDQDGMFYFMEMNTRLQVEHTITEMVTGIDLVKEQIKVAQGEPLTITQENVHFHGYALQCRILSEYYNNGNYVSHFGEITRLDLPGSFGVRVDCAYEANNVISPYYDSLLCKIACQALYKEEAVRKMIRCLDELRVEGVSTNKKLLLQILKTSSFISGDFTTTFLEQEVFSK